MREQLAEIDRRSFSIILGLLGVLILVAVFTYMLIPAFKEYREYAGSYKILNATVNSGDQIESRLAKISGDVVQREKALHGDASNLPFKQFESHVIGQLQTLAWQHNLLLAGVKPGIGERVDRFQEVVFDVEFHGGYFDLYRMLEDFHQKLGFVVIKKLDVKAAYTRDEEADRLAVSMVVASYRVRA